MDGEGVLVLSNSYVRLLNGRLVEGLDEMCGLVVCGESTRKGLFLLWYSWGRRGWKQLQGSEL